MLLISNGCAAGNYYKEIGEIYPHPLMFSLFLDDYQYIKLCKNLHYYMDIEPTFINLPNNLRHVNKLYPIMKLEDIVIHWIHATSESDVLSKWNRRVQRFKNSNSNPIFIIWPMNNYKNNKELNDMLRVFLNIKNSYLIANDISKYDKHERIIQYDIVKNHNIYPEILLTLSK